MFADIQEIKKYVNLSSQTDVRILSPYIEEALRVRIFPYISEEICEKIKTEPYYELLKKAVANYALAYSIPFLKVHLSNTGGNHFTDEKTQKASWWDLRDLGISATIIADKALNSLMEALFESPYKTEIQLFQNQYFTGVWEIEKEFSIGSSWEIFSKLLPIFDRVWDLMIAPRLGVCGWADFEPLSVLREKLKKALLYFSLAEITQFGGVSFTENQALIQWEQLPWQQSKILTDRQLEERYNAFLARANALLNFVILKIKTIREQDPTAFLCFIEKSSVREIIEKKSGIYL